MKTQIEALIDKLSDKSLTFGCLVKRRKTGEVFRFDGQEHGRTWSNETHEILGHPILIGDVLQKMKEKEVWFYDFDEAPILELWKDIGFTKSLQEILASTKWDCLVDEGPLNDFPKDKATRDLFEFLLQHCNNNEDE